jgi:hypothetical protein
MNDVKLSDFISDTLVEIARGIKKANTELQAPENDISHVYILRSTAGPNKATLGVKFDVALSVSGGQRDKAGFVVALASIGGGANIEKQKGHEQAHRIQFEVGVKQAFT